MASEDIRNRQWTDAERRAVRRISKQQATGNLRVNLDIPRLTEAQLANMVLLVAWLKSKGEGHLTRINDILSKVMEAERRTTRGR